MPPQPSSAQLALCALVNGWWRCIDCGSPEWVFAGRGGSVGPLELLKFDCPSGCFGIAWEITRFPWLELRADGRCRMPALYMNL